MEAVAKCEKCGRGFLSLPRDGIDHYYPANKKRRSTDPPTKEQCGGRVVAVTKTDQR